MTKPTKLPKQTRKVIAMADEVWERVARYRHMEQIGSEADAVRQLMLVGLDGEEKRLAKSRKGRLRGDE